jgi:hypothetical protein
MAIFSKKQKSGAQQNPQKAEKLAQEFGTGPFLAVVETNSDYTKHGSIQVVLKGNQDDNRSITSTRISCRMLLPYYTVKDIKNAGKDPQKFEDTQQSAGMIFPAPDVGTEGLIIFVNNNIEQAIWLGALPEIEMNHMIPEPAARTDIAATDERYNELCPGEFGLPVANYNKNAFIGQMPPSKIKYPIHPVADILKAQGLLNDPIRGLTTSTMRREDVNQVFGINTPGRYTGDSKIVGAEKVKMKVTRPGGHAFTMDDGDGEGNNNLVRLRTKGGHQILLHDTNDLIYITNSKGTAWIELTSEGKMDVWCDDSISMRTKADFNLYADRDFNVEARRNINFKAGNLQRFESDKSTTLVNGAHKIHVKGNSDIKTRNSRLDTNNYDINTNNFSLANRLDTKITSGNIDLGSALGTRITAGSSINIKANGSVGFADTYVSGTVYTVDATVTFTDANGVQKFYKAIKRTQVPDTLEAVDPSDTEYWEEMSGASHVPGTANTQINLSTVNDQINLKTTGADVNVQTDKIVYVDGTEAVHLNKPGPGATAATNNVNATPAASRFVDHMGVNKQWEKEITAKWEAFNYYRSEQFETILKRVPTHEPWDLHENTFPDGSTKNLTDREV